MVVWVGWLGRRGLTNFFATKGALAEKSRKYEAKAGFERNFYKDSFGLL
jgi:hypothetical protein